MMGTKQPLVRSCRSALTAQFRVLSPEVALDSNGYVANVALNLLSGVHLAAFEAEFQRGAGQELKSKFRALHSSSALAVNTFAPFKSDIETLRLLDLSRFTNLQFERKCPHGVSNYPPNLDVVLEGEGTVVAVESKFLEPLSRHAATFSRAYKERVKDERKQGAWFREMLRVDAAPASYCWLDAAQLIKHALGVALTFRDRETTLLYLFWEPANPQGFPVFAEHRKEVARFSKAVAAGTPSFVAMSYPELWDSWEGNLGPEWVRSHVARLRARYVVTV